MASYGALQDHDDQVDSKPKHFLLTKFCIAINSIFGIVILATALAGSVIISAVIEAQLDEQLTLTDSSSPVFQNWADPTENGVDIYMTFSLWNLTNHEAVLDGATPELELVGPWTYTERRLKHSFTYNEDKSLVYYKENKTFYYYDVPCPPGTQPMGTDIRCSLPEDAIIRTINIPLMTVVSLLEEQLGMLLAPFMGILNSTLPASDQPGNTIFVERTMPQVVFGFDDPLLKALRATLAQFNITDVTIPPYEMVANNSIAGRTNASAVFTRSKDGQIADFEVWQGYDKYLNLWNGCDEGGEQGGLGRRYNDLANMINGSEGSLVNPPVSKDTRPYIFVSDLKRSSAGIYNNSVDFKGIDMLRFVIEKEAMQNSEEHAPNCAFSSYGFRGVMNLTAAYTAPIFASKPFFLDADDSFLLNLSRTYKPDYATRYNSDTFLDIEPNTGAIMNARLRLQLNLQFYPIASYPRMSKLAHFYLPFALLVESSEFQDELVDQYNAQVGDALEAAGYYEAIGPFVGVLLITIAILLVVKLCRGGQASDGEEAPLVGGKVAPSLADMNPDDYGNDFLFQQFSEKQKQKEKRTAQTSSLVG